MDGYVEVELGQDAIRPRTSEGRLERNLLIAADLVMDMAEVRAVHVIGGGRRPTYAELARLREHAAGLTTTVDGRGCVSVRRPNPPAPEWSEAEQMGSGVLLAGIVDRLSNTAAGLGAWHAWFPGIAEGTR